MNSHPLTDNLLLTRIVLRHDGKELIQLSYEDICDNGYHVYSITFSGVTEPDWWLMYNQDFRDIRAIFVAKDYSWVPFHFVFPIYYRERCQLGVKYIGDTFSTSPRYSLISSIFTICCGRKTPEVPIERAPRYWGPVPRRSIEKRFRSSDVTRRSAAIAKASGGTSPGDIGWVVSLLLTASEDNDPIIREKAVLGFGEMARIRSYTDSRCIGALVRAKSDVDTGVKTSAEASLDLIARFIPDALS